MQGYDRNSEPYRCLPNHHARKRRGTLFERVEPFIAHATATPLGISC
jgi:hypothetical protein